MPVVDPDGVDLSNFERKGINLNKDFPKIPGELWSRYIALCFHMCPKETRVSSMHHDDQYEVQVCLLRDVETLTKWKIVVPKQIVSGVSVKSDLTHCIDIETGEKYEQFPPEGWLHAGSSHSHNTMEAFFSYIDDKSELSMPGLHIVVGEIDHKKLEYSYQASIVLRKMRKEINIKEVVDVRPKVAGFHLDCLDYIDSVLSATKKFYAKFRKKYKKPSKSNKDADPSSDSGEFPFAPEASLPSTAPSSSIPFFDEDGKPTNFLYCLNRNNSDLFDDDPEAKEFNFDLPQDKELAKIISERLNSGATIKEILATVEAAELSQDGLDVDYDVDDEGKCLNCGGLGYICDLSTNNETENCPNCDGEGCIWESEEKA